MTRITLAQVQKQNFEIVSTEDLLKFLNFIRTYNIPYGNELEIALIDEHVQEVIDKRN